MMVHYRKDENGNIILSEYMFNRLMKSTYNKEKEIVRQNKIIKDAREYIKENDFHSKNQEEQELYDIALLEILDKVD